MRQAGTDRVHVHGATGSPQPDQLKVTVGFAAGLLAEAGISYAGLGAGNRATLAMNILKERLAHIKDPMRFDLVGASSIHATAKGAGDISSCEDLRLRVAVRTGDQDIAEEVLWETEALLCCGPAGGGGFRRSLSKSVQTYAASLQRNAIQHQIHWHEV